MRRALYEFFGLPRIPRSPEESLDEAVESTEEIVEAEPIHIPQPVRPIKRMPVSELKFHDLGEKRWLDWATRRQGIAQRGLRYVKPDELRRLPIEGIAARLVQGDTLVIDLSDLAHMDSQRRALMRQVQDVAGSGGLPVFALDEDERLLLVPGRATRVDTETHELGEATGPLLD